MWSANYAAYKAIDPTVLKVELLFLYSWSILCLSQTIRNNRKTVFINNHMEKIAKSEKVINNVKDTLTENTQMYTVVGTFNCFTWNLHVVIQSLSIQSQTGPVLHE